MYRNVAFPVEHRHSNHHGPWGFHEYNSNGTAESRSAAQGIWSLKIEPGYRDQTGWLHSQSCHEMRSITLTRQPAHSTRLFPRQKHSSTYRGSDCGINLFGAIKGFETSWSEETPGALGSNLLRSTQNPTASCSQFSRWISTPIFHATMSDSVGWYQY